MKNSKKPAKPVARPVRQAKPKNNGSVLVLIGIAVLILALFALPMVFFQNVVPEEDNTPLPIEEYDNYYAPPEGTPSITILRPKQGEVISSSIISIKVNVTNFAMADIVADRQNVENQGHLIYKLDGGMQEKKSVNKDDSMANVAKGTHVLTAELVNNDDTPLSPPVTASVSIMIV